MLKPQQIHNSECNIEASIEENCLPTLILGEVEYLAASPGENLPFSQISIDQHLASAGGHFIYSLQIDVFWLYAKCATASTISLTPYN